MYRYRIDKTANIVRVAFEGDISIDEYRRFMMELVESPDFRKDPIVLIDQRQGRLEVSMEEARSHPSFVQGLQTFLGRPKVAVVVSTDRDFGMNRMFELSSAGMLEHTGRVFRDMDEALEWLGIEAAADPA